MFPNSDPYTELDLFHQRAGELRREVDADRIGRAARAGRHRRFGRASGRPRQVRAPSMP
ncbi:hypothetical protein AB0M20_24880 [Actinoplanes sp. NPDC051633]|jgi:hypothetical protein|uniref:hypothetical protein n=1 Tax=Actinoplanes sp. NPDC051633 TaxID=3155670 RepID=UPI00342C6976